MNSPITLDALRTLDAIDRRHSFAAAAEELYRVPSAVSYTVNKLEEELGVILFDRTRRKAELTPVGRLLLEQGRQILLATEDLTAMIKQAAEGWEPKLSIGIDTVLGYESVYKLIEDFQKIQPGTEIHLMEEVLGGTWDALNSERCDIVIGAEGRPPRSGFGIHSLGLMEFRLAVAKNHPLTQLTQPLPLSTIQQYPTIIIADSSQHLPVRSAGIIDGRSRIVVPSTEHKIDVQCKGLGVGFLPLHRIKKELNEGSLQIVQLQSQHPPQPISVAWRDTNKGKALNWFIHRLKKMKFDQELGLTEIL